MKRIIKILFAFSVVFFANIIGVNAKLLCTYDYVTINVDGTNIEKSSTKRSIVTGEFNISNFKTSEGVEKCPSQIYCKDNGNFVDTINCSVIKKDYHDEIKLTQENKDALNLNCVYGSDIIEVKNDVISLNGGSGKTDLTLLDFYDSNNAVKCPEKIYCSTSNLVRTCSKKYNSEAEKKENTSSFRYLPPLSLGKLSCDTVFKNEDGSYNQFYYLFWNALKIAKYAAIALTLGLSLIDFIKVIASGNKDELQKVVTKSIKRLIIGVVLFFVPSLLEYVMQIIGNYTTCNIL